MQADVLHGDTTTGAVLYTGNNAGLVLSAYAPSGGEANDNVDEESDSTDRANKRQRCDTDDPDRFSAVGLRSTREANAAFGLPIDSGTCIGCRTKLEGNMAAMPEESFRLLSSFISDNILNMNQVELCRGVQLEYNRLREKVNSDRLDEDEAWPEWSTATIRDHIWNHTGDPELHRVLECRRLKEMMRTAAEASTERNEVTGVERLNVQQTRLYIELGKAYQVCSRADPKKQAGFSNGAHVNPRTRSQGAISMMAKNLYSHGFVASSKATRRK